MEGINQDFINSIGNGIDTIELYVHEDGVWKKSIRSDALVNEDIKASAAELFGEQNIRVV